MMTVMFGRRVKSGVRVSPGVKALGMKLAAEAGIKPRAAGTVRPQGYYLVDHYFGVAPETKRKPKPAGSSSTAR